MSRILLLTLENRENSQDPRQKPTEKWSWKKALNENRQRNANEVRGRPSTKLRKFTKSEKNSSHFLNQSDAKQIVTWSHACSRAWRRLRVFLIGLLCCLCLLWLARVITLVLVSLHSIENRSIATWILTSRFYSSSSQAGWSRWSLRSSLDPACRRERRKRTDSNQARLWTQWQVWEGTHLQGGG